MGKVLLKYHPSAISFIKSHINDFNAIQISPRLFSEIRFLGNLTTTQQQETGGFIVKTGIGIGSQERGLRIVNWMIGQGREIVLEPQENLEQGEEYMGTFHCHPITLVPSIHDVLTFISDPTERIMIVNGVDGTINVLVKTENTRPLAPEQIEQMKPQFEKGDMATLVRTYEFVYFQGKDQVLPRVYEIQPIGTQTIPLDELAYGIQGSSQFPSGGSKKAPKQAKLIYNAYSKRWRFIQP